VHADAHRHAGHVTAAERLGHRHRVAEVEAGAAELRGVFDAGQTEVVELLGELMGRELLGLLQGRDLQVELFIDEPGDGIEEGPVLLRVLHRCGSLGDGRWVFSGCA
jgi:hypothetical protein